MPHPGFHLDRTLPLHNRHHNNHQHKSPGRSENNNDNQEQLQSGARDNQTGNQWAQQQLQSQSQAVSYTSDSHLSLLLFHHGFPGHHQSRPKGGAKVGTSLFPSTMPLNGLTGGLSRPSSSNAVVAAAIPCTTTTAATQQQYPLTLRSNRDWFVWLHALRTMHPLAWPYVDPDSARPPSLPEPGAKPRPTDIRSPEATQLGSPISTTSTVAEDWDAELAAFRSLSDGERRYYFEKVREWEGVVREKKMLEEALGSFQRDVLGSVPAQVSYLVLGSPGAYPTPGKPMGYAAEMHEGMKRLARRYKPSDEDIDRWLHELGLPDDKNWEDWLDKYLAIYWIGRCCGSEEMRGEESVRMFLERVQHLTETWAKTWGKKIGRAGRGVPDVFDLSEDWRQWMEFRREHKGDGG